MQEKNEILTTTAGKISLKQGPEEQPSLRVYLTTLMNYGQNMTNLSLCVQYFIF